MGSKAANILAECSVTVSPETFSVVSVTRSGWMKLVAKSEFSPRMTAPFVIFMDQQEVTLVLDDTDLSTMRPGLDSAKIEGDYRLLTFETVLNLNVVGFMAEISRILADAGVSILALSAFSRDHLLIKQHDLASALKALGPYNKDLC